MNIILKYELTPSMGASQTWYWANNENQTRVSLLRSNTKISKMSLILPFNHYLHPE